MHPAKSVIFFTTASGAGYGLLVWLAIFAALGVIPAEPTFGLIAFGIGFALVVGGLLSSTFHLGRPERAWRALSQWRTSWLSREGLAAFASFVPLGLFAVSWIFFGQNTGLAALIGLAGAAMSLLTVYTTSMIYASLRTIPAWHNGWTVVGYLLLGPMNGLVLLALLLAVFGQGEAFVLARACALVLVPLGLLVKVLYWSHIRSAKPVSTIGTATGLGHLGKVEMTASPHDQDNYLLREMGFRIARKHADKLRLISGISGFALPFLAVMLTIWAGSPVLEIGLLLVAAIACQVGVSVERWLFFAEARHAVTLYYGEQAV